MDATYHEALRKIKERMIATDELIRVAKEGLKKEKEVERLKAALSAESAKRQQLESKLKIMESYNKQLVADVKQNKALERESVPKKGKMKRKREEEDVNELLDFMIDEDSSELSEWEEMEVIPSIPTPIPTPIPTYEEESVENEMIAKICDIVYDGKVESGEDIHRIVNELNQYREPNAFLVLGLVDALSEMHIGVDVDSGVEMARKQLAWIDIVIQLSSQGVEGVESIGQQVIRFLVKYVIVGVIGLGGNAAIVEGIGLRKSGFAIEEVTSLMMGLCRLCKFFGKVVILQRWVLSCLPLLYYYPCEVIHLYMLVALLYPQVFTPEGYGWVPIVNGVVKNVLWKVDPRLGAKVNKVRPELGRRMSSIEIVRYDLTVATAVLCERAGLQLSGGLVDLKGFVGELCAASEGGDVMARYALEMVALTQGWEWTKRVVVPQVPAATLLPLFQVYDPAAKIMI